MKNHYTYVLVNPDTDEFYIGVRSCDCDPEDDDYRGSMKTWQLSDLEKKSLKRTILGRYATREEAEWAESELIQEHCFNPLNRNYHVPGWGFIRQSDKY